MYDAEKIIELVKEAKECKDKPTLIMLKSVIGKGAPKQGTSDVHGAPLGVEGVKAAKKALGLPEDKDFYVIPEAYKYFESKKDARAKKEAEWQEKFDAWSKENPDLRKEWDAFYSDKPTAKVDEPVYKVGDALATRDASNKGLNLI